MTVMQSLTLEGCLTQSFLCAHFKSQCKTRSYNNDFVTSQLVWSQSGSNMQLKQWDVEVRATAEVIWCCWWRQEWCILRILIIQMNPNWKNQSDKKMSLKPEYFCISWNLFGGIFFAICSHLEHEIQEKLTDQLFDGENSQCWLHPDQEQKSKDF